MPPSLQEKVFPISLDALKDIRDYVQEAAKNLPLSSKKIYKLQLAVDEIATNIVLYSGLTDEEANILLKAEVQAQSLRICLKDRGIPFDPRSKLHLEQGNLAKPAEERQIGGLGIYLAITGVDEFRYEYRDGFNVNQLDIHFS